MLLKNLGIFTTRKMLKTTFSSRSLCTSVGVTQSRIETYIRPDAGDGRGGTPSNRRPDESIPGHRVRRGYSVRLGLCCSSASSLRSCETVGAPGRRITDSTRGVGHDGGRNGIRRIDAGQHRPDLVALARRAVRRSDGTGD